MHLRRTKGQARRTHRESNRDLLAPGRGPREEQVGDVRTDDQQHGDHAAAQERRRPARVVVEIVDAVARRRRRQLRHLRALALVGREVALLVGERRHVARHAVARRLLKHAVEIALHVLERGARLQPADHLHPVLRAFADALLSRKELRIGRERQRHVRSEIAWILHAAEALGRHADDGHGQVVDGNDSACDRRIRREPLAPEGVADDADQRDPPTVVVFRQQPADAASRAGQ